MYSKGQILVKPSSVAIIMAIDTLALFFPPYARQASGTKLVLDSIDIAAEQNGLLLTYKSLSNNYGPVYKLSGHEMFLETTKAWPTRPAKLTHIRTQPSHLPFFRDTEELLRCLDYRRYDVPGLSLRDDNGIYAYGDLCRIDYLIDLPFDISTVMMGLYIVRQGALFALQDMVDPEEAYAQHEFRGSDFRSFRIGTGDKYLRIYDLNAKNNLTEEQAGGPRTRVELSLNRKTDIRAMMNSIEARHRRTLYEGKFSELRDHLTDIAEGRVNPFQGVLLNHIIPADLASIFTAADFQRPDFMERIKPYTDIQRDLEQGLFINVCRRLSQGGNFWRRHHRYFSIHPWRQSFQLTHAYRQSMRHFLEIDSAQPTYGGDTGPHYIRRRERLTRWPVELTQ